MLVVEDDARMAAAIGRGLRYEGLIVDVVGDGLEALARIGAIEYEAVVLDVMLPGMDGVETCRRLRERAHWVPVLMLTARDAVEDRVRGLDGGADDYMTKPFSLAELTARLRALARRGQAERPAVLEAGPLRLDPATRQVSLDGEPVELSAREFALLEAFMRRPGQVLTQGQLLDAAWDAGYEQRSNVVEVYVRYLRRKLGGGRDRDRARRRLPAAPGRRRMSRVPIRVRLAALVALAMMLVLAGVGLFVYLRVADDLDESLDTTLEARAAAVAASGRAAAGSPGDAEDGFALLLAADGRVLERTGGAEGAVLTRAELARAASDDVEAEREIDGVDGTTRLLAERHGSTVVVVGQSLDDRDETLAALAGSFALGAPIAALVVALLGYALAAAGLRPVERMRARAAGVSLEAPAEPLPLPAAHDEIHRLGTTLNEMLDRLRGSYDRERRFVADASHELRTPVAVIKAELEGALRRAPADPDLRESLTAAVDECDRLAQLAEDLLVLARSGDGALAVRPAPLDPAELLERVRTRFSARAAEHGRALRRGRRAGADPRRRRAAALAGARQPRRQRAAPRRGRDHAERAAGRRGGRARGRRRGRGPAPEVRPRAFERFARGDEARTRGGAGLGLAIVRAIAEAHGGDRGARPTGRAWSGCACRLRWIQARAHTLPAMPTQGGTT